MLVSLGGEGREEWAKMEKSSIGMDLAEVWNRRSVYYRIPKDGFWALRNLEGFQ